MIKKYILLTFLVGYTILYVGSCTSLQNMPIPVSTPTPTIDNLINGFSSSNVMERANAAYQAGFYRNDPNKDVLVPYLVTALQEPDCGWECSRVRVASAQSIRYLEIYDDKAIEILTSWLTEAGHSDDELIQAIQTLGYFADYSSDATPGLIHILKEMPSSSPQYYQIRTAVSDSLSKIGDPVAVPYLLSMVLLPDQPAWVQKSVSISLARYGTSAKCAIPYLIPILDSNVPERRIGAAVIINESTGNDFPDSNPKNWYPANSAPWKFEQEINGDYSIVAAAKAWWQNEGSSQNWPHCNEGLDGENIVP